MNLKHTLAWKYFSTFIKERDNWTCFTCGAQIRGKDMHCGHFIQAFGNAATFFDERNNHAQCRHCNITLGGNKKVYRQKMIEKYGSDIEDILLRQAREIKQYTKQDIDIIAETYKRKCIELNPRYALLWGVKV